MTLAAVVQLAAVPQAKTPFISKWQTQPGKRSYELGVTPSRQVFFTVTSSGNWDGQGRELLTPLLLRVGSPYCVVAVYEPGKRMVVFINGVLSGALTSRVPASLFDSPTPVLLGNRRGSEHAFGLEGILAGVWVLDRVLDEAAITAWAKELGLTEPPEPEFPEGPLPPVRAITRGPKFHWFGYYDKLELDPTGRYVLGMEVDFEHRAPDADDVIKVGMVDTDEGDRWIELGESRAWCWQQGCMLQWRPRSSSEVLWNDRRGDQFISHILDVFTREKRTIPRPIYTIGLDGRTALSLDFRRVNEMRSGYGYAGYPDPNRDVDAPTDSGIFRIDLANGEQTLIVPLSRVAEIPYPRGDLSDMKHYFNVLLFSPDGSRFAFLHRWRGRKRRVFGTRLFTAKPDGTDIRVVDDFGRTSHFIWRDPKHILAWSWHPSHGNGYYVYDIDTRGVEIVGKGVLTRNGHCTYLPGHEWILTDTYPDWQRKQHPYLYHVAAGKRFFLGHFLSPRQYSGSWRCDTHPRFSPDGRRVVIDSPHGGNGRQLYLIDVSGIVRK